MGLASLPLMSQAEMTGAEMTGASEVYELACYESVEDARGDEPVSLFVVSATFYPELARMAARLTRSAMDADGFSLADRIREAGDELESTTWRSRSFSWDGRFYELSRVGGK